jgi:hypothetical protein
LCYLHTTNVISEDILLEATKLAQVKCVERANWIKELAAKYIEDREIPLYQRAPGPRTTGAVVSISEAEKLPKLKASLGKKRVVLDTSSIKIMEEISL